MPVSQTNLMAGTKIFYGVHCKTDAEFRTKVAMGTRCLVISWFQNSSRPPRNFHRETRFIFHFFFWSISPAFIPSLIKFANDNKEDTEELFSSNENNLSSKKKKKEDIKYKVYKADSSLWNFCQIPYRR